MSVPSFVSLEPRARWAVLLLVLGIAADVVAAGVDIWEIVLIERFQDGRDISTSALASSDDRQSVISAIQLILMVATAIMFIRWFYAAYRNTAALEEGGVHFKPGWAIGAWFVPILNLWRPKQIANEIWLASGVEGSGPQPGDSTVLLTRWWILWVVSGVVGNITARTLFTADSLDDISDSDFVDVVSIGFSIAAAAFAIAVVQHMTRRQVARARRLGVTAS
jgi:hypothetical protein